MSSAPKPLKTLTQFKKEEQESQERPIDAGLYSRMFSYTLPYRLRVWALVLWTLMRAAQLPLIAWLLGNVIKGPIKNGTMHELYVGVLVYTAAVLFMDITFYFRIRSAMLLGEGVIHDIRNHIFSHIQTLTMSYFHKTKIGRFISRFTSDSESLRGGIQDAVFVTIVNSGQMLVTAVIMIYEDKWMFAALFLMAPVYYFTYSYFRRRMTAAFRDSQESFSRLTANLAESVNGIRVTQGFVRQDLNAELFNGLVEDHAGINTKASKAGGQFNILIEMLNQTIYAMLFLASAYLILRRHVGTFDDLITYFFLTTTFLNPLVIMSNLYNIAVQSMAGAERVFKVLDRKPDFVDDPDALDIPQIAGRVEFRKLAFSYEPGKPVLQDVTFTAKPGQTIALVGHTGSGKSSIINLISKFYLPDSGELLIDGYNIHKIKTDSLHKQMGIVLQVNFLFTGTVIDNIRVGRSDATHEEVLEACRQLDCLDLFEALPEGLNTRVGERGSGLSLGQRQLVCFARAMIANPRIMILDEATSAVDTMTESRIQKSLSILLQGRTSFVVAHRLSTIRHADVVLVLDHGRIVERGSHNELLATGGIYANLYHQFIRATQA